jgi:hypothetical protein
VMTNGYDGNTPKAPANGSGGKLRLLTIEALDGRTKAARDFRDIEANLVADLGGEPLGVVRRALVRRFAAASVIAEALEARFMAGEAIDVGEHAQITNTLVRVGSRIGLERLPKEITPTTLGEYIESRRRQVEEEIEAEAVE